VNIIGLDMNVLTGWYQSKVNTRLASNLSTSLSSGSGSSAATSLPPWDVRGDVLSLEEMSRKVLATGVFFRDPDSEFSDADAPDDHKSLFSLHQGLKRLAALAEEAKEKSTSDSRRNFLDSRFSTGLSQLDSYFADLDLQDVNLLKGEELRKMESEVAISRGLSQFKTGTIHTGAYDDEVASLTGSAQFTVSVTKSGITTDVNIDLADMGATTRNVDNIVAHINTELEAAGMVSRFERAKIGTEDEDGNIAGNNWGFLIKGVSTESLTFSAATSEPAVYFAGVSGINQSAGGQIVKLTDLASGTPQVGFSRRFDADPDTTEVDVPGSETGETRTKAEPNPLEIHASIGSDDGGIFVVGHTTSSSDGQVLKGAQDLVLAKYDSTGNRVWSRVLGAAEEAEGTTIAVDADGNVVVAGNVTGDLGDTTDVGGTDALVAKYDSAGVEQWVRRMGGTGDDAARSVAVGSDGTIYVAGKSASAFGGEVHGGGLSDGFVRAIGSDGETLYTRRVGTSGDESIASIAIADDGDLLIASEEGGNAVLRKFAAADGDSAQIWEQDLGSLDDGKIGDLEVDGTSIYLTGAGGSGFSPSAPIGAHAGGVRDAFVVKMTDGASATIDFTTFVGSDADDTGSAIEIHDGKIYIAGKSTGAVAGGTLIGERDAFAAQLDATTGALDWATQISGRGGLAEAKGLVVKANDDSILDDLGLPTGKLVYSDSRVVTDRSAARDGDHFYVSVDGGRRKKVTIDNDDSMRSLTFKINAALILDGTADVRRSSEGDMLRIKAAKGKTIELFAGSTGKDLLQSLGMKPGAIINTGSLLDKDTKTSDAPTLFAMELPDKMSIGDVDLAAAARESLDMALSIVQRAYRDLTMDPALKELLAGPKAGRSGGTVPAHMQAQLNNYSAGLARLNNGPSGGGVFF
jgi:hypothetical protein